MINLYICILIFFPSDRILQYIYIYIFFFFARRNTDLYELMNYLAVIVNPVRRKEWCITPVTFHPKIAKMSILPSDSACSTQYFYMFNFQSGSKFPCRSRFGFTKQGFQFCRVKSPDRSLANQEVHFSMAQSFLALCCFIALLPSLDYRLIHKLLIIRYTTTPRSWRSTI